MATSVAHLFGQALVNTSTDAGIFALGVLADDDPVKLLAFGAVQRHTDARKNARGAHVGVLVEWLANRQAQAL